jgi:hypothetical protein
MSRRGEIDEQMRQGAKMQQGMKLQDDAKATG